jgi:lysophospholipase L1-like esterase
MTSVYVISDSYALNNPPVFTVSLAARLGWTMTLDAQGGTGYASGVQGSTWFADRVSTAIAAHPDIVMVVGSVNDQSKNLVTVQAQALATLSALKAAIATVYAVVFNGSDGWTNAQGSIGAIGMVATRDAIKAGAIAAGVRFIDGVGWISGTGGVGAETGDGNADVYIETTLVHPSAAGHAYLGDRLAFAIMYPYGNGVVHLSSGLSLFTESGSPITLGFQP